MRSCVLGQRHRRGGALAARCEASLALLGELTVRLAEAGVPSPEVHVLNEASLAFQFEALRGSRAFSADEVQRADYEAWVTLRTWTSSRC